MKRIVFILALLFVLLLPSAFVWAAPFDRIIGSDQTYDGDITVVDDRLVVEEGGAVNGNVTVFSGSADIAGTITGSVNIFGGETVLSGTVDGDLVVFGGSLELAQSADVTGSCLTLAGSIDDDSDDVSCTVFGNRFADFGVLDQVPGMSGWPGMELPEGPEMPARPSPPPIDVRVPSLASRVGGYLLEVSEVIGRSLLMGILALVVTAIFPRQLQQVSDAVRSKPAASGIVGLLTAIAAPSIIVLLLVVLAITCVGLLLYPAVFLLGLALFAALIMGWIAVGDILGRAIVRSLGAKQQGLPVSAALGTALLTLILGALGLVPFVWGESLVYVLLACVGLGAATLTQFGTRPYPPTGSPRVNQDKVDEALQTLPPQEKGSP